MLLAKKIKKNVQKKMKDKIRKINKLLIWFLWTKIEEARFSKRKLFRLDESYFFNFKGFDFLDVKRIFVFVLNLILESLNDFVMLLTFWDLVDFLDLLLEKLRVFGQFFNFLS